MGSLTRFIGRRKGSEVLAAIMTCAALASVTQADDRVTSVPMPGPAPQVARGFEPATENARCETCHTEIAREWRGSMHAQAYVDPVYQRALAIEPTPFCRGCHAPEADPSAVAPKPLADIGVSCVTCHVTGASQGAPTTLAATAGHDEAPHPVFVTTKFAGSAACAACHEFDFPVHVPGQRPDRMQSTVSEHAASAHASQPCDACHMPTVDYGTKAAHHDHAFATTRDLATLASAVHVTAARVGPSAVTLTLELGTVGHAFPTGDLFRRLVVSAEAVGDDWAVVGEATRALHRRFAMREYAPGHRVRQLVGDDRVGVGPSAPLRLDLGERARGRAVAWRVEYQRVEHPLGTDEAGAIVAQSTVVAEGLIPALESER